MIAGHRWEYSLVMKTSYCVGLPEGGVESYQWCIGCGVAVTDFDLCRMKLPRSGAWLDFIAAQKGFRPIEAGTMAEFRPVCQGKGRIEVNEVINASRFSTAPEWTFPKD